MKESWKFLYLTLPPIKFIHISNYPTNKPFNECTYEALTIKGCVRCGDVKIKICLNLSKLSKLTNYQTKWIVYPFIESILEITINKAQ